jgi:integrase
VSEPVYKRCKCRGGDGKELGADCPKLKRSDGSWNPRHGTWYFALELPLGPNGKRRPRMRRGGFATRDDAAGARDQEKEKIRKGADPSVRRKTGDYLTAWLDGLADLKQSTRHGYGVNITTYWVPLIGHIYLGRLCTDDVAAAFTEIRRWNDELAAGRPVRRSQRHVGPAAMARIRDTLRAALNDALDAGLIGYNPAVRGIRMEPEGDRKPTPWTPGRVAAFWKAYERDLAQAPPGGRGDRPFRMWRTVARRPSPVMVWTPADLGKFLDCAAKDRLSPVFELAAATGMRRGELCGLRWADVDLAAAMVHIVPGGARVQVGWDVVQGGPKSDAGRRDVPLDALAVANLRAWQARQKRERLAWGGDWEDTGLVFTLEDGAAPHPSAVTDRFERLAFAARLPPVRLHDVRHAWISYALGARIDARIVSETAGHSGTKLTRDYAAVMEDVARQAAETVTALIPRKPRRKAR